MEEICESEIIKAYNSAVESFENLEALLNKCEIIWPEIFQNLIECQIKIEIIVVFENQEPNNNIFPISLIQLKQQFKVLQQIISRKLPLLASTDLVVEKHLPNYAPSSTSKKRACDGSETSSEQHKRAKSDKDVSKVDIESVIVKPKVKGFSEIVGLRSIKKVLKSLIILPKIQPQLFVDRQILNSILLFGPPGTGKTRLAHAVAAEANAPLYAISISDILSPFVGNTEKTIKMLFQHIKSTNKLSVLFLDEIDGLCRKRSDNEQEYSRRVKTELMCQMSDTEGCRNVFLICATNCPWDLDSAILRRFQKRIYIPLPDRHERLEFFKHFSNVDGEKWDTWENLLDKTDGYSFSDLANIVQNSNNIPLLELVDNIIWKTANDGCYEPCVDHFDNDFVCKTLTDLPTNSVRARNVTMADILLSVDEVNSTVSSDDIKKYEDFNGNK